MGKIYNDPIKDGYERKNVNWVRDYNFITDKCDLWTPYCPYCNELPYRTDFCVFCGKEFDWVECPDENYEFDVEYKDYFANKTGNGLVVFKNGSLIYHATVNNEMTKEDVIEMLKKGD